MPNQLDIKNTKVRQMMRNFDWISRDQALAIVFAGDHFFGFDGNNNPVITRGDGNGVESIGARGNILLVKPPVTRTYLGEGSYTLRAVVEVEVKVTVEEGLDEQVEAHLREYTDTRNKVRLVLEDQLRLGANQFADLGVGWLDDERELLLDSELVSVSVRGLGVQKGS